MPVSIADAELVARLQGGSEEAFRVLVEQYQGRVYRTVLGLLRLRVTRPDWPRPYRVVGYPLVPILYCVLASAICISLLIYEPQYAGAGLALVAVGAGVYYLSGLRRATEPPAAGQ